MSDLQEALQQVLRQVREETLHSPGCTAVLGKWQILALGGENERYALACSEWCDFAERVEAEQARRWAASVEAAIAPPTIGWRVDERFKQLVAKALTAARRPEGAAQQERGSA